jgi:hypothetical protein
VQRGRRTTEAAPAGYRHERPDLVHVHDDIQVADAGIPNYALNKCVMPADFGNREISGHLAVAVDPVVLMVRSASSRVSNREARISHPSRHGQKAAAPAITAKPLCRDEEGTI